MSNGFGFSFNSGPNDPNNNGDGNGDDGRNQNPFGAFGFGGGSGNLGDILNQFGQMISGVGNTVNNTDPDSAVNYELAARIARQQIGKQARVQAGEQSAVEESVRLAELWLDDVTTLPGVGGKVAAWNSEDWLEQTLPAWKRMVTPVARNMSSAQLDAMPAEAREMMGPMSQILTQMSGMNFGMQLGHALGDLAIQALTGCDFGLPVAPSNTIGILPGNASKAAQELGSPKQEVLVYIAAREAARQRLFKHVPWLVERLVSSVEEYAAGLVIDTSHIEEATRELNLESGDPQAIQEALGRLQGMDLSPRITSRNGAAVSRLETLLALVEGWAEFVVDEALGQRIPTTSKLTEAWRRRRATGGRAEKAFSAVVGIEFAAPKVADAVELWRRTTVAVGPERRDKVWEHPDLLPNAQDLKSPAAFIDGLLDDAPDTDFDEEMAKLEEMVRRDEENPKERGTDDGSEDGTEY